MANLFQFQKVLQILSERKTVELILFLEIERFQNVFIRLQKEQLSKGETNTGGRLKGKDARYNGFYKESTEKFWALVDPPRNEGSKQEGHIYDFEWSGNFMDGIELQISEDKATFWSKDSKTELLTAFYADIFGLQPDKLKEVISRVIYPAFMSELRTVLHLE